MVKTSVGGGRDPDFLAHREQSPPPIPETLKHILAFSHAHSIWGTCTSFSKFHEPQLLRPSESEGTGPQKEGRLPAVGPIRGWEGNSTARALHSSTGHRSHTHTHDDVASPASCPPPSLRRPVSHSTSPPTSRNQFNLTMSQFFH